MTIDNLVPIVIVGVIVISSIGSGLRRAKRGFDGVVEKQRAEEPQRMAALKAKLASRGITASPALQRMIATLDTVAAAETVGAQAQQAPVPPPAAYAPASALTAAQQAAQQAGPQPAAARHGRHHRQQQQPPPPPQIVRAPVSIARSMDVPLVPAVAPSAPGGARRMLAEAFADPAHARNAVILLEVLGPPVALR